MIYLINKGHDYRFEVSGLVSMFTSEFSFKEDSEVFALNDFLEALDSGGVEKKYLLVSSLVEAGDQVSVSAALYDKASEEPIKIYNENSIIDPDNQRERKKEEKKLIKKSIFSILVDLFKLKPPWGILTGIRPSKIVHELLDEGKNDRDIIKYLSEEFFLNEDKISLLLDICKRERKFILPANPKKISLYISIPFCPTRCRYCSFPSNALDLAGNKRDSYVQALEYDIKGTARLIESQGLEIESLYIGGGTPTALEADQLDRVITAAFRYFDLRNIKEFTVEAGRPDSISEEKLKVLKNHGVSRISINPQTMRDETLEKIGRNHKAKDVIDCFNLARRLGFDNINMDIILGLEGEDLKSVEETLRAIEKLNPESLTVHTLALKRASDLNISLRAKGKKSIDISSEQMNDMIELAMAYAKKMGMNPYYMYRQKHMAANLENIGYAKEGKECLYNMQIMEERQSNYALGAGAISKFVFLDENRIERVDAVKNLDQYIDRIDEMVDRKFKEVEKNANKSTEGNKRYNS